MSPRDLLDIVTVAFSMFGVAALVFGIVHWDERRLSPEKLDRAWPPATRIIAVFAFGPLCLPVHFWRTRRSVLGVVLGLLCATGVVIVHFGIITLLETILV